MTKVELDTTTSSAVSAKSLKALIEQGKPASLLDVLVTPELAKLMLSYNTAGETNRKLKRFYVLEQAEVLRSGQWINTGEPVIFAQGAVLNDGQHRLETVVAANVPAVMDIRIGVSRKAFASTNTGHKRSAADTLGIAGFPVSNMAPAICRMVFAYHQGLPNALRLKIGNALVLSMCQEDPVFMEATHLVGTLPKMVRNAPIGTCLYFALKTGNEAAVREFAEVLRDGGGSPANPPHRLRELCLRMNNTPVARGTANARVILLACALQAWIAFLKGSPIGRWWKPGEAFPAVPGTKPGLKGATK